jgi:hypothetical protein
MALVGIESEEDRTLRCRTGESFGFIGNTNKSRLPNPGGDRNDARPLPVFTFFEVCVGCKPSLKVQQTSDYRSKAGFPCILDRPREVVSNRRNRGPKLYH